MGESTKLSAEQRNALACLSSLDGASDYYLAGGTGVAAHLNHRTSVDLDIFTVSSRVEIHSIVNAFLAKQPESEIVTKSNATVTIRVGELAVDIVQYDYELLSPASIGPEGFGLAGLLDLAAMKLSAITNHGIYRDFWDLHEILTASEITLSKSLDAFTERFGVRESDIYPVLKALTYFEDAEAQPVMPRGLSADHWTTIKTYFRRHAPALLK